MSMIETNLVTKARLYATAAHAGQFRRDGVTPYITHPAKVVELLGDETETALAAAWLHDVLEDTVVTVDDLLAAGFPLGVVEYVAILSHAEDETYDDYIKEVKGERVPRLVKIADMLANLTDTPTPKQVAKYTKAILYLAAR